jgi:chromosome segregation ATPase
VADETKAELRDRIKVIEGELADARNEIAAQNVTIARLRSEREHFAATFQSEEDRRAATETLAVDLGRELSTAMLVHHYPDLAERLSAVVERREDLR